MFQDERLLELTTNVRAREGNDGVVLNALCIVEEMGKAIQQIRRFEEHGCRSTTLDAVGEVTADVPERRRP